MIGTRRVRTLQRSEQPRLMDLRRECIQLAKYRLQWRPLVFIYGLFNDALSLVGCSVYSDTD
jgi:hypothetical protein